MGVWEMINARNTASKRKDDVGIRDTQMPERA